MPYLESFSVSTRTFPLNTQRYLRASTSTRSDRADFSFATVSLLLFTVTVQLLLSDSFTLTLSGMAGQIKAG